MQLSLQTLRKVFRLSYHSTAHWAKETELGQKEINISQVPFLKGTNLALACSSLLLNNSNAIKALLGGLGSSNNAVVSSDTLKSF